MTDLRQFATEGSSRIAQCRVNETRMGLQIRPQWYQQMAEWKRILALQKRHPKRKRSLLNKNVDSGTDISTHYWQEQIAGRDPKVSWKFVEKNVNIFKPIINRCRLCVHEQFTIVLKPSLASLNSRQQRFSHCCHMQLELLIAAPD